MHSTASPVPGARDGRRRPSNTSTSFVGREAEIGSLVGLLGGDGVRLVTITGRSGAGKTRLALEATGRVSARFPGGAVFLDVDTVDDAALVPSMVAAALDLRLAGGVDPEDALRRALRYTPTLLIADDLDALPGAAASLVDLVGESAGTIVLATAAAPLRLPGELVLRLAPLSVEPAVELFAARAAAVDHAFRLTDANAGAVAELCRRLDGLPLAVEIAAARAATLSPAAQLSMLERAGALDLGPRRTAGPVAPAEPGEAPERHADLRAAIGWSHRLAGDWAQVLLRRMGIFEGGASLEALEAVCAGPGCSAGELLDALMELVDVHLVEPVREDADGRFRLRPTIAEFAREQLAAAGELDSVEAAYIGHVLAVAAATRSLRDAARADALAREQEHLHAVLAKLVERGDTVRGLTLAADVAPAWERHGYFPATRAWLDRLIADADAAEDAVPGSIPAEPHSRALSWSVTLDAQTEAATERRVEVARRVEAAVRLARASGSAETLLLSFSATLSALFVTRDLAGAIAAAQEGLVVATSTGDPRWIAEFEAVAAMVAQQAGDIPTAVALGTAAINRSRAGGYADPFVRVGWMMSVLPPDTEGLPPDVPTHAELLAVATGAGDVAAQTWLRGGEAFRCMTEGRTAEGAQWALETLELARRTGSWFGGALPMVALVLPAAGAGDYATVARLHATVTRVQSAVATAIAGHTDRYFPLVAAARAAMGAGAFDRVLAESMAAGWDANLRAAEAYATSLLRPVIVPAPENTPVLAPVPGGALELDDGPEHLTPRELDVLRELAQGHTNNEIGEHLGMRPKTVMHHSVSIYAKLGLRGRAEATAWAFRNGLMEA
ncbi:MAG TPA: LuxR C-terminal-related transcriptional regulator [Candidatus Limnocylindrales bacterium]|nr:LuxR C-terminal-related transcriptional regulator [Candidatus Limnocylindrales bacterium]